MIQKSVFVVKYVFYCHTCHHHFFFPLFIKQNACLHVYASAVPVTVWFGLYLSFNRTEKEKYI
jgi:hypothetical protein